jgi:error-prone DNA polymerase
VPDCLAILLAAHALGAPQPFEMLFAHALWVKTWFGDRAALGLSLLHGPHDALLVDITQRVATLTGLPIVAVGGVLMHSRCMTRSPPRG